jgi:hypothetical protein
MLLNATSLSKSESKAVQILNQLPTKFSSGEFQKSIRY